MIKKIFFALALILCVGSAVGQQESKIENVTAATDTAAQQYIVADEVAAIIGNSAILLSDIENMTTRIVEMRKTQGTLSDQTEREEAFEMLLTQGLLTTRARIDSLEKDLSSIEERVESQIQTLIATAGGIAELERRHGKPIYQIRADVTLDIKQSLLAQEMERKIRATVKIGHSEVRQFVDTLPAEAKQLIPIQYVYSQIVKAPAQTDVRRYAIRERLLEYRQRILAGEISLGALAMLYSADPGSAKRRGEIAQSVNGFEEPFADAIKALKPGEVSEIVETKYGYHIIELISSQDGPDPKIYPQVVIRHILLKPEFSVEESRQVVAELDSLITEIRSERMTFADAALKFSTDLETRENGGKAFNKLAFQASQGDIRAASSRFMPDELMPMDYRNLSNLKPGEMSEPFETYDDQGNKVYKVIRLDRVIEPHAANIDEDYDGLESYARQAKEVKVIEEWIDEMIGKTYIDIKPDYLNYKFTRPAWKVAALRSANRQNVKITDNPRPAAQPTTEATTK